MLTLFTENLNNRDWAILLWSGIGIIYLGSSSRTAKVRLAFIKLLKILFQKNMAIVLFMMITYVLLTIFSLHKINLWQSHQIKNSLIWAISFGFLSLLKLNGIKDDPQFFKTSILDNLKLLTIIQFIVSVYPFNIFIEIILIPILFIIAVMNALAHTKDEFKTIGKPLNAILSIIGGALIIYFVYMLISNFGGFAKTKTIYDFTTAPILTVCYTPFLLLMMIFTSYEISFIRLRYQIKDRKVLKFAKIYAIIKFHYRIRLLERWVKHLSFSKTDTISEIKKTVRQVFKMIETENNPPTVQPKEGWSPYYAKNFLIEEGLKTKSYHPINENEWHASTNYVELPGKEFIANNIAFYINGNETIAEELKLILNLNSPSFSKEAISKMLSSAKLLFQKAFNSKLPSAIEESLILGQPETFEVNNFVIKIEKNIWPNNRMEGYNLNFSIAKTN